MVSMGESWPGRAPYQEIDKEADHDIVDDSDSGVEHEAIENQDLTIRCGAPGWRRRTGIVLDSLLELEQAGIGVGVGTSCEGSLHGDDTPCPSKTQAEDNCGADQELEEDYTRWGHDKKYDAAKKESLTFSPQNGVDDDEYSDDPESDGAFE